MPVLVFYKDKSIAMEVAADISSAVAKITKNELDAAIEVRVVEQVFAYNANEIHIEMRFRDFVEWTDEQLASYHENIMSAIGNILKDRQISCAYSFYIIPSLPPRSIWAQAKN